MPPNLMEAGTRQLLEAIHAAARPSVFALAGGGTSALADLLSVPGASRTILELIVPYSEAALCAFLGRRPEQFCSAETARALAGRAYDRAQGFRPGEAVLGLGCTASLATDRPKKGDHRFFLCLRDSLGAVDVSLVLAKGRRDRLGEEAVLGAVLLNALARRVGVSASVPVPLLDGEALDVDIRDNSDALYLLSCGREARLLRDSDGRIRSSDDKPPLLLSGSFNPVHAGHWGMLHAAAKKLGMPVAFEMSVTNVDKPPLAIEEIRRRLLQFTWLAPVWLTRAPTFVEKARLFPGAAFVVGTDTAVRIVEPRYYGGSAEAMHAALAEFHALGCRFLVAERGSAFRPPAELVELFVPIGREDFFLPISSTELRQEEARRHGERGPSLEE